MFDEITKVRERHPTIFSLSIAILAVTLAFAAIFWGIAWFVSHYMGKIIIIWEKYVITPLVDPHKKQKGATVDGRAFYLVSNSRNSFATVRRSFQR